MKTKVSKRKRVDEMERKRLLKLSAVTLLVFAPGVALWIIGEHSGWFIHPWKMNTPMDGIVTIFWSLSFLYFGFAVHVLPQLRRVHRETIIRHWTIAAAMFGSACLLYTLHFSGTTRELGELISRIAKIGPQASGALSTILSWIVSGLVGNFAYEMAKRIVMHRKSVR